MNPQIAQFNSMQDVGNPSSITQAAQQQKAGGIKGVLEGLLPLAGGALGAIGGSFFGGPVGTAAGGAAGSSLGEVLKEKLQGGPISAKNVLEQGAFGALPGAIGGVKAIRAGGDLASLVKGTRGAEAAAGATNAAVTPGGLANKLYTKGIATEANAGGFGQGAKVAGSDTQGFRQAEKTAQALANENIPAGSAGTRQIAVGDKLQQHSATIDAATNVHNPATTDPQMADLVQRIQKGIVGDVNGKGIPGFIPGDNPNSKFAGALVNQLGSVQDAKGLLGFKRALDEQAINYGRNSASPDPIKEQIAKVFRSEVNKDFGSMVPEAKVASESYAKLADANEMLKAEAAKTAQTAQGGEGLVARVANPIENTVRPRIGQAMQSIGKMLGATPGEEGRAPGIPAPAPESPPVVDTVGNATPSPTGEPAIPTPGASPVATASTPTPQMGTSAQLLNSLTSPKQVLGAGIKQAIPRSLIGAVGGTQSQQPTTPDVTQYGASSINTGTPNTSPDQTGSNDQSASSPYPLQNYLTDVSNDPSHESTYTALYKELNPDTSASSNLNNLTSNQKNQLTGSQNAIAALQSYTQQIQQLASGSSGPVGGTVSALLGKYGLGGNQAANAYALNSSSSDVATQIAAGLSSTGRATQGLITQVKESLPKVTDSPQAAQAKVQQLVARLQDTMQTEATPLSTYIGNGQ